MAILNSVLEAVGRTPLIRLSRLEKAVGSHAVILAKAEGMNPGGSAKDRVALQMIADAEADGRLVKGGVLIEPTSGNTGIGLSMAAAVKGYRAIIVMPENMSEERKSLMRAYGAELVLTPASEGMAGAIARAEALAKETPNAFLAGQFVNPSNAKAHYLTTGPEIYADTQGKVDVLVAGVGTGGTLTGTAQFLKEKIPTLQAVAVEPETSAVLSGKPAGAHGLQGIGAGFIPEVLHREVIDEVITASTQSAYEAARLLAKTEGILSGISAGAALSAAIQVAKREENANKTVVVILPDTGERYLSTTLFSE